jgi:uncharacterized membrane protein YadS
MTFISITKLAESVNDRADARLPSTIQRWPGRNTREILPGLFLNWVIAGAAFAIRQLPGMATFSPMILPIVIGIAFHNIVGTAGRAKQGVTFSLRWLLRIAIFPLGLLAELLGVEPKLAQLIAAATSICGGSAVMATNTVTNAHDEDVAYAIACVTVLSVAMFFYPIPAHAKAWIVAATTFHSIALATMGLATNIGKLTTKSFQPALPGALAFLFIAGFSLTLIKLME